MLREILSEFGLSKWDLRITIDNIHSMNSGCDYEDIRRLCRYAKVLRDVILHIVPELSPSARSCVLLNIMLLGEGALYEVCIGNCIDLLIGRRAAHSFSEIVIE